MIAFIRLFRKVKLKIFYEYEQNNAFLIIFINAFFVIKNMKS